MARRDSCTFDLVRRGNEAGGGITLQSRFSQAHQLGKENAFGINRSDDFEKYL